MSEKLQTLRKEHGLTQEQLADKIFVSRTAVSKWESGRGAPSLVYLKSIAKLFSISIDDLLSGEELIKIAEADSRERTRNLRDLVFGIADCLSLLLFFLPFFGRRESGTVLAVSLLALDSAPNYIRVPFIIAASVTVIFGLAELALQNCLHRVWLKFKTVFSLAISAGMVMLFIVSPQPYAAAFMFCLLILKGILLMKQR